ncbi:hypothetical protein [Sphingomonas aracearum]|uniref:Lipoprotein n=1 Tax=Sphingomonas aracearum TaxID=2283317 RepID=A0A369W208_9SPHN|nr:hypothetical protein [Sphingomonas aracearum]RDE06091.1 hypothetical protein DVW87_09085 [Sphingomonas aracearum]
MRKFLLLGCLLLLAGGCVAKTAWNVATLPVRAGSQAVDWATTSQSEADRNYGRKMRKQEAREGRERKKALKQCRKEGREDCASTYQGYRAGYPER